MRKCPLMLAEQQITGLEMQPIEVRVNQIIVAIFTFLVVSIAIHLFFFSGNYVWWISYYPLSPLSGDQVSWIAFRTLGASLFGTGFYLGLYRGMKALGFSYSDYKAVKFIIWLGIVKIMDWVQLLFVNGINEFWSFYWNSIRLIVFLWPSELLTTLLLLAFFFKMQNFNHSLKLNSTLEE